MKTKLSCRNLFPTLALLVALVGAGCQSTRSQSQPASGSTSETTAAARTASCADSTWGLICLSKSVPPEIALGSEFAMELKIVAQACAANVVVRDAIPAGVTYLRSEPAAVVEGSQLIWKLGDLDANQTVVGKVWYKAEKEGAVVSCATVTADPRVCVATRIGKPVVVIEKTGPDSAVIGAEVTYQILVKNTGTAVARGIVVTDAVPAGMSHSSGKSELTFDVGDLNPGQSKPLAVTFKANQRGKICNIAIASSSNAGKAMNEACTVILVPGLKVEKTGTKEQILGRNADYEIHVTNTGDTTLQNVVLTDVVPPETMIIAAPGANIEKNKATWTIASLAPRGKVTQTLKLTSKAAGTLCNTATAVAGEVSDTAKACTLWKGIAAVTLEVVDNPDPIQIGESTVYTIKVTNQGFADIHNVKVTGAFDDEVAPVSSPQGTVTAQAVNFSVISTIKPKQTVNLEVTVKGVKPGDSRNRITLRCDELKTPVDEEESTTIY